MVACLYRLHDRKIFVLGLCTLLSMTGSRPQILNDEAHRLLPSLILVFKGLKRAYECKISLVSCITYEANHCNQGELITSLNLLSPEL